MAASDYASPTASEPQEGRASGGGAQSPISISRSAWATLAIAALATAFVWVDATALNIAFPDLERSFSGASTSAISWVLNAYNIVFAALLVPAGRLADVVGRKRLFVCGLAVFGLASAFCAAAPSSEVLIAMRLLQGAGAAAMVPAALALVLAAFPPVSVPMAIGLWVGAGSVAAALGPLIGGSVIAVASWRWIFVINVPIAAAGAAIGARLLREVRTPKGRWPDLIGSVALALAITGIALALVEGDSWGWGNARTLLAFACLPAFLAVAVMRSRRHPAPALDLSLIKQSRIAVANAGTLLFGASLFGAALTNVLFLTTVWRYSELRAALGVTPPALVAAVVSVPAGRLLGRFPPRWIGFVGVACFAAGIGWLRLFTTSQPGYISGFLTGGVLFGAGIGIAFAAFATTAIRSAPPAGLALASSMNTGGRQVGAVLGVALVVAVIGHPSSGGILRDFHRAWVVVIGLTVLAGAMALALQQPASPSSVPATDGPAVAGATARRAGVA